LLYLTIFIICFFKELGAYCSQKVTYPWIFIAGDSLFFAIYFTILGLYLAGFPRFGIEFVADKHEDLSMTQENISKMTKEVKLKILIK